MFYCNFIFNFRFNLTNYCTNLFITKLNDTWPFLFFLGYNKYFLHFF
jgi:hypothetical protein